jgi:hypothetical protein
VPGLLEVEARVGDVAQAAPRILRQAAPQQPVHDRRRFGRKRRVVGLASSTLATTSDGAGPSNARRPASNS